MRLPFEFVASSQQRTAGAGLWLLFRGRELLVHEGCTLPAIEGPHALGLEAVRAQFLGELAGQPCFSGEIAASAQAPESMSFTDLRALHGRMSDELLALSGRALQLMDWDRTHQFCGACGGRTRLHEHARARLCENRACGLEHYPRVAPAMIVLVERGPEILLARSPHFPPGVFAALAGFVDPGESVEECVHREVREETGIAVQNLRYFGSQPWPFPHSLMLGFFAEYAGGQIVPEPGEIEAADFFHVDALPKLFPGRFSVANQLIADFCARQGRAYPG